MAKVDSREETSQFTNESIIEDYRIGWLSRHTSIIGRKEVLTGKAKFGIFGDGKEVAQLALARAFRPGDIRSGYYRDQTLMFALGVASVDEYFAQLYANAEPGADPFSAGRQMNAHFATRMVDEEGKWLRISELHNSSADISPTGAQMPRLVGLAYASKLFRNIEELHEYDQFSKNGDEIAWGTIGNASCAEGMFWESINAAGVLKIPMVVSIWDDGYGISVPNEFQITKGDLSELLVGFQREQGSRAGHDVYRVRGWDYPALCETYLNTASIVRKDHVPSIIHVIEVTQPQGHSTSGSHERYKSKERLEWEQEFDCLRKMKEWMIGHEIASSEQLEQIENDALRDVREAQKRAWDACRTPIEAEKKAFLDLATVLEEESGHEGLVTDDLKRQQVAFRRDLQKSASTLLVKTRNSASEARSRLVEWVREHDEENDRRYADHLYSESPRSALKIDVVEPEFGEGSKSVNGFEVLNACFDQALERFPRLSFMGEDVGQLGDVNQGCAGLQVKYGELRVVDTGIREATIVGQAIGMAMRGLRPVAEMQYLDYVLYGLQLLSDDLSTVRWRTGGAQMAPAIIRTRGHRLEGVWHSGSPMSGIVNLVRGMWVCVPRNMVQAAGMYNTLFQSDDPAIVVEVLNGYRLKEELPSNVGEFTVPLGVPEVIREGRDVTVVTYGPLCRIADEAAGLLSELGIEIEIIDVQTLLPFDRSGVIVESLKRTNRIVFLDEDVPGGTTAYMMRNVLDRDDGYEWLDSKPVCLSATDHRPAYGSDGDYWSKPSREDIVRTVYELMREARPKEFAKIW